ncbi:MULTISPECIES: SMI1/KNR4 family protein [unclassified Chelatococcus]|uniref:SMI1/KNR4 family protein n=1 Tax=unclassified Chelatococcus TaxID=2638111 RepID=UPI001BCD62E8|nr:MULTISPECIES: SMI1/KNR4 family protein [unclassified Chelatococcus]MBS7696220.1 SMI1/KNR4 family protein [Chelatococcus sp. YT9]MBX3557753.1 SMI1/KNR4 family protein [Chelatococcus sp.]
MDLQTLNPKVFAMWELRRAGGPVYFQESSEEDVAALEEIMGRSLPEDYKEFLLKYSTIGIVQSIGAGYFPCKFPKRNEIHMHFTPVLDAKLTFGVVRRFCYPHPDFQGVSPRVSRDLLPLTGDNQSAVLIDLRPESFGNVLYLPYVRKQVFGKHANYGWNNVGYVAPSFTDFLRELGTEEELKARYPGWKVI